MNNIYAFDKGELKSLLDINQELKNIFSEYIILEKGIVVGTNILTKGMHIALDASHLNNIKDTNYVEYINAQKLFESSKINKKLITDYIISDKSISLTGAEASYDIGYAIQKESIVYIQYIEKANHVLEMLNNIDSTPEYVLTEDEVKALVSNEFIVLTKGKYKTRITREVIPGLKKKHSVSVRFMDDKKSDLFKLIIKVYRTNITSYHIYSCIYV